MVSQRINKNITAAELRKEAERRELVEKARYVYMRRLARNHLVHVLLNIDYDAIKDAGAHDGFKHLMTNLMTTEVKDREKLPTRGEVDMAGTRDWWKDWNIEEVHPHPAIIEFATGRCRDLRTLAQKHSKWMEVTE